jgi:hypothetical protein
MFQAEIENRGEQIPLISDLLTEAKDIEKALQEQPAKPVSLNVPSLPGSDGTDELISSLAARQKDMDKTPTQGKLPHFSPLELGKPASDEPYQESFTSQQETAELRSEISDISSRLTNLEAMLEGVIAERKSLPEHMTRLNTNINKQLTLMNDRLNAAIEVGLPAESMAQMSTQAHEIATSSSAVIGTMSSDLQDEPSKHSQTSQTKPITGKKKRVRLIR